MYQYCWWFFYYKEERRQSSSRILLLLDEGQEEDGLEGEVAVEQEAQQRSDSLPQEGTLLLLLGIEVTEGEEAA